jgi:excisionase family DNA binding protein
MCGFAMKQQRGEAEAEFDSVGEFADFFKISKPTVYRGISDGQVKAVRVLGSLRIPRTERERIAAGSVTVK